MAEVIKMPRMSDTMEEGVIVAWLKNEGDPVESGETLAEVETDKATMELDSYFDGVLLHIAVKEGAVPIDGVIAVIGEEGEDWQAAIDAAGGTAPQASKPTTAKSSENGTEKVSQQVAINSTSSIPVVENHSNSRIFASPLAKSIASEKGISLTNIVGSGDNGRIIKRDIEAFIGKGGRTATVVASPTTTVLSDATPIAKQVDFTPSYNENGFEEVPVSQMRKTIARRLGESKFSAPHFYLTIAIDMTKAVESRKSVNAVAESKISFNDFVIKAAAVALKKHPTVNSSWLGDKIRYNKAINIGVAVAVPDGLLVPVINNANFKTLSQLNAEVKHLAGKAKSKKLQPDEMTGNTFTISNLGMFGIEEFTAIINPPDACILAVGGIAEQAVVKDGEIGIGKIMKVTLSCDHRVVDGATGAKFLNTFKSLLEDPVRLLV